MMLVIPIYALVQTLQHVDHVDICNVLLLCRQVHKRRFKYMPTVIARALSNLEEALLQAVTNGNWLMMKGLRRLPSPPNFTFKIQRGQYLESVDRMVFDALANLDDDVAWRRSFTNCGMMALHFAVRDHDDCHAHCECNPSGTHRHEHVRAIGQFQWFVP